VKIFRGAAERSEPETVRLHIGCGSRALPGWINIDQFALPGVDRVLDVGQGLPFENVRAIYAEHFLEHLSLHEGLAFLRACRRSLAGDGVLRISTPNLDWVVRTHYHHGEWSNEEEALRDCVGMNRAFHGWHHQYLYNRSMLTAVLRCAAFADVTYHRYGESDVAELSGLEGHEKSPDEPALPHVLIAQAAGVASADDSVLPLLEEYRLALISH
jgi:predicted SAM-dependent methyltransferase